MTITYLTVAGWFVIHALWQGALLAGFTALVLGLLQSRPPAWRYRVGCVSLALMVLSPAVTMLSGVNASRMKLSPERFESIASVVSFPAILWWASVAIPVIGALWLTGLAAHAVLFALEASRVSRLRRAQTLEAAHHDLQIHGRNWPERPVRAAVRTTPDVIVPMVVGWRHPLVLLPAAFGVGPAPPDGILLHELAHVARRDYLVNLFQVAADACLFFHPGARWVSHHVRTEREFCCDDMTLDAGADRTAYARALASLEESRATGRLAVLASAGTLLDRLQRIAGEPRRVLTPARGTALLLVAVLTGGAILAVASIVPPSLPWRTEVRRRVPPAAGVTPGAQQSGIPRSRQPVPR